MRVTGPARLAVLALTATSVLALTEVPSDAATVVRVGNDKTQSIVAQTPGASATGGYYNASHEAIKLVANPANGQTPIDGTVVDTGTCAPIDLSHPSLNGSCDGPITFTAPLTDVQPGTYDIIETRTDAVSGPQAPTNDGQVYVYDQPRFTSMTPATRGLNSVSTLTVKGTGFVPGTTVDFGPGTSATNVVIDSIDQLRVDLTVSPTADLTTPTRDVTLTSPDDGATVGTPATDTKAGALTLEAAPTVTGLSPASGVAPARTAEQVTQSVTVTGTGFVTGPDLVLSIPQATVANVKVVSPTQITADVTPLAGATAGPRTVGFKNGDAGRTQLASGFSFVTPPAAPTGLTLYPADTIVYATWTAPAGTVSGYRVTVTPAGGAPTTQTTTSAVAAITGLTNGKAYTVSVAARNDAVTGTGGAPLYGPESASATATPRFETVLTSLRSPASSTTSGTTVRYYGHLSRHSSGAPVAGGHLAVTMKPDVGAAVTKYVITDANGNWYFYAAPVYNTTVSARFGGDADDAPSAAATYKKLVATKVTVSFPESGASSSSATPLVVSGTTSPNKAGRTVGIYRELSPGRLQLIAKAVVASNGTYRVSVALPRGTYALRTGLGTTTGNSSGYSALFKLIRT